MIKGSRKIAIIIYFLLLSFILLSIMMIITKKINKGIVEKLCLVTDVTDKIYFLNTGTSDAIILESNGQYGMIDTGDVSSREYVISFLKKKQINKLNFIIITHFHTDHYGGLTPIMNEFTVGKIYIKKYNGYDSQTDKGISATDEYIEDYRETNKRRYNTYKELANQKNIQFIEINDDNQNDSVNQGISLENIRLSFYNRADRLKSFTTGEIDYCLKSKNCSENVNTIVIYGEVRNKKIYFSGDIENQVVYTDDTHSVVYQEKKVENEIALSVKNTKLTNGTIDLYKASHHGFVNNNTGTAINYLQPKSAVVTNNIEKYTQYLSSDYPRADTTTGRDSYLNNLLKYVNGNMYVTGNGDIVVSIDSDGNMQYTQTSETPTILGDIDKDGKVTLKDVLIVLKEYLGIETLENQEDCDIDKNNSVNLKDVILILKIYLEIN